LGLASLFIDEVFKRLLGGWQRKRSRRYSEMSEVALPLSRVLKLYIRPLAKSQQSPLAIPLTDSAKEISEALLSIAYLHIVKLTALAAKLQSLIRNRIYS